MQPAIDYAHVADIYDCYVQTTFDVPFFLETAQAVSGPVLELMCGTGRVSIPLIQAGVDLTCVDYSPEMLAAFRLKLEALGLTAGVLEMDVRRLALNREFAQVLLPFNSFAEIISHDDQQQALAAIYRHTAAGGHFLCTLHNPPVRLSFADGLFHVMPPVSLDVGQGTLIFSRIETYSADEQIVTGLQFFERYSADGVMVWKRLQTIRFCVLARGEFQQMAEAAGFTVAALYGDYDRSSFDEQTSRFMIWDLLRP